MKPRLQQPWQHVYKSSYKIEKYKQEQEKYGTKKKKSKKPQNLEQTKENRLDTATRATIDSINAKYMVKNLSL